MKRLNLIFLTTFVLFFSVQAFAQRPDPSDDIWKAPCLTDPLSGHLHQAHPQGVPGRTQPIDIPVQKAADFDFTYVIPVVVHVMHDNGPELGVTAGQVASQIDVLNEDYGRYGAGGNTHPDGSNARIRFCLASIDPDGNATTGINYVQYSKTVSIDPFNEDTLLKRTIQWDPERYLNIWVVRDIVGQIVGYSYFPSETAGSIYDGLVVDFRFFGRGEGTATSLGRTATHEVGHYMDLFHPWGLQEGQCFDEDDECDDTPQTNLEFFSDFPNCIAPITCVQGVQRQIENYMDYSDDGCMNLFTNCQTQRMRNALLAYRYKLVSSDNLALTGCSETIDGVDANDQFYIYPNPATDVVMVYSDFESDESVDIDVYDFEGRLVYQKASAGMGRGPVPIDMSRFNEGMYHVMIRTTSRFQHKRLLIAR